MWDKPRPFALVPADLLTENGRVFSFEAIGYGVEAWWGTFVCLHDPDTDREVRESFASAEQARTFYSRWGELSLIWPEMLTWPTTLSTPFTDPQ